MAATNVSWTCIMVVLICTLMPYITTSTISSVAYITTGTTSTTSTIPSDCSIEKQLLECDYSSPKYIPSGISKVYIRGYNKKTTLISTKDEHNGWKQVAELDITIAYEKWRDEYHLNHTTFSSLTNLKILGIHGRFIKSLQKNIFAGLNNLESLDLSGCMFLSFQDIILPSILSVPLPKLSFINLAEVERGDVGMLVINNDAVSMLIRKSITSLSLRGTHILLKDIDYDRPVPLMQLDISNITFTIIQQSKPNIGLLLSNLKTLNFSKTEIYNIMLLVHVKDMYVSGCWLYFPLWNVLLENFYVNKVSTDVILVKNSTIDLTKCAWPIMRSLKRVHMRYNNIHELNGVLKLPKNNIQEVDFSHNVIKIISPTFIKDLKSLRNFSLAYNNLHYMEHQRDFVNLLKYLTSLEEFNIAHNHLTFVPRDMFSKNRRLRSIDLSGNYLETVDFRLDHLTNLIFINLKGNKIKSLPEQFRTSLTAWLHTKNTDIDSNNNGINLENNDLECSCETKDFVSWMIECIQPSSQQPYSCSVDGNVNEISVAVLEEVEYLCIQTIIMISTVLSSCISVALVTIVVVYIIHRIRIKHQQDLKQKYLNDFKDDKLFHGKTLVKYITFLAHSSADVAVVARVIYNRLNDTFNTMTGVKRPTVCLGDRNFRPGFSIVEQTMQCLEQSCAAIVIVSESFCRSQWCEMELREAYELQKPIVLIFTERIDENLMSPILLNIFRRQTRATIYNRDGQYVLEPSWTVLCEAVVTLASMHHQHDRGVAEARGEVGARDEAEVEL